MILYALTIVVSAFLLFQVQPVIAKIILPWFGGSAAVWTTCLLFFQMVLLLGYLYSHAVIRYLKPRAQMLLHGGLLLASVVVLPIYPSVWWKPVGAAEPTLQILGLLAVSVGMPYFLLSTTGPLLQAWYTRRFQGAMPYRLYALSNAGSMFALLSYPVLIEPAFNTHQQSSMWSWGFGVFVVLCAFTAFRSNQGRETAGTAGLPAGGQAEACPTKENRGQTGLPANFRQTAPEIHGSLVSPRRVLSVPGPKPTGCGCCCRPWLRCCFSPSPITFRRMWRPFPSCGCCR